MLIKFFFLFLFEHSQLSVHLLSPIERLLYFEGIHEVFQSESNKQGMLLIICNYLNVGVLDSYF